jgi:hypothetical protein
MALADELLEFAQDLASLHPENPRQVHLRRAVSTAYYALFHLLISEATLNWARVELRAQLGRVFEHGKMKAASENKISDLTAYFKTKPAESPERIVAEHMLFVCKAFTQSQQRRNDADYNTGKDCTLIEVDIQIREVTRAFRSWAVIREEPVAQAYLVFLFGGSERRDKNRQPPPAISSRPLPAK